MKANRLISILMILQANNQITASELATRLEVSVRTIYRDIDELSSIGIPIICDRGQGGGIKLLGDYKTTLTGLNPDELNYLFMPSPSNLLEDLDMKKTRSSTFEKLLATLPAVQRTHIKDLENYIYIDMEGWQPRKKEGTHLITTLQRAIWDSTQLTIKYQKPQETKIVRVCPLSLVLKRSVWYLIALDGNTLKTYRVSSIKEVLEIGESFVRPENFNLEQYWLSQTATFHTKLPKYPIKVRTTFEIYNHIKSRNLIRIIDTHISDNEITLSLQFDAEFQAIELIMGYGPDMQVIEPPELIDTIHSRAQKIIESYIKKG